jgi:Ca2+/Na+ antiporter
MVYLYLCFLASKEDKVLESVIDGIKNKKISLGGALEFLLQSKGSGKDELLDNNNTSLKRIMRPFFAKYDADNTGDIEKVEFTNMLRDLDDQLKKEDADALWKTFDVSGDGVIKFDEFCIGFVKYLAKPDTAEKLKSRKTLSKIPNYGMEEDEDGEEEIPEDLADLSYEDQQRAIKLRAAWMMALGTTVVVLVSDPFVDVLTNWGDRLGIPAFYISFVVAPFASNASELLSAYTYAKKKTKGAITTSLSTLIGAACMNNTFCLGIFYGLIYFGGLAWQFTAETVAIILIQWIIGVLAVAKETQTWFTSFIILLMYPFCLFLVYYLENVIGWD